MTPAPLVAISVDCPDPAARVSSTVPRAQGRVLRYHQHDHRRRHVEPRLLCRHRVTPVPYAENAAAKAAGAQFDWQARRWYAPRPGMPGAAWAREPAGELAAASSIRSVFRPGGVSTGFELDHGAIVLPPLGLTPEQVDVHAFRAIVSGPGTTARRP